MRGFKNQDTALSTASTPIVPPTQQPQSRQNGQRLRPSIPNDQVGQHSCSMDLPALSLRSSLDDLGVRLLQAASMPTLYAVFLRTFPQVLMPRHCSSSTCEMGVLSICFVAALVVHVVVGGHALTNMTRGSTQTENGWLPS